jgi:hypothetical protein
MNLVEKADEVFGDVPRPRHFTNYEHCCECAEYDELLGRHDPKTIGEDELGDTWTPICFTTDDAFRYYFPAFVRLAVEGRGTNYCVRPLLFHLMSDGPRNRRWASFSPTQRRFVVEVLEHLVETQADEIDRQGDADDIFRAIEIWSDGDRDLAGPARS